ncbi:hypothetical protein L1887_01683 [Cichorium endivia]|nr:hypothetical protein L1887_01683 [Cichorium endivia]
MTEDLEEGNIIFKIEAFLSYVVLSSWRDSILVLKSCEKLSPWAENLQIVRRCSESIAWKACANPKGIRWQYIGKPMKVSSPSWNEMKDSSPSRSPVPPDWWYEHVSILRIDHFVCVITVIKVKGMRYELVGAAITHYATKSLPGLIKRGILLVTPALVTELEKRVGMQFEQTTLADLLILCYNKTNTSYDVDLVQRLLEHFLIQE